MNWSSTQQTITQTKLIIETLQKGEIFSKLTLNTTEKRDLVDSLLTLNIFLTFYSVFIVYFEQVNVCLGEMLLEYVFEVLSYVYERKCP